MMRSNIASLPFPFSSAVPTEILNNLVNQLSD